MNLIKALEAWQLKEGITDTELAEMLYTSRATLWGWFVGGAKPDRKSTLKIKMLLKSEEATK